MMLIKQLENLFNFRSIPDRFNVSKSTSWEVCQRICNLLLKVNKKYKIIAWPSQQQQQEMSEFILQSTHFPGLLFILNNLTMDHYVIVLGVIGIIDGTHIPIAAPAQHKMSYFNRIPTFL